MQASLTFFVGCSLAFATVESLAAQAQRRPNIVVILADDLGYGDIGTFGARSIRTPRLDAMASQGQKWTHFYVQPVCSPSRSALLTGRLPVRNGMFGTPGGTAPKVLRDNAAQGLPIDELTIAELLRSAGYATGMIGKWHLGHLPQFLPMRQGFDSWLGVPFSHDMGMSVPLMRNEDILERPVDHRTLTKRYTDEAVRFIAENANRSFFLYVAHSLPHVPLATSKDFVGRSAAGIYGDVVEELDWSVGRILDALRGAGIDRNTLVLFTSDNGPWLPFRDHAGSAGPLREGKGTTWEGGVRTPAIFWWPGTVRPGVVTGMGSGLDLMATAAALSGAALSADRTMDGVDLGPVLKGKGPSPRTELYYYWDSELRAVRKGRFKAHFITGSAYGEGEPRITHTPPLLFDLETDPGERRDIATAHPAVVADLIRLADVHRSTVVPTRPLFDELLPSAQAQDERRVESILGRMTLEEKIDILGGVDTFFIRDFPHLGIPRMKMADGSLGVRNFGPATAFAGGIALAATWNPRLAARIGTELGRDARAKGVHVLLGPGVNIYRAPMNGRNFEYFGEDPVLASRLAVEYIKGVQAQGVSATVKHFVANDSEFDRHNTDATIDERTLREIYLPPFEAAIKEARVGAVMSSYNLVNGEHASQHRFLLTNVAREEWGFDGVMMSDWYATHDGVAAANAGQDLEMPSGAHMNRKSLLPAIEQGRVSVATIDEKVRRILRIAVRFGWLDREQTDRSVPRLNQQGRQVALDAARESLVLLKNDGNLLPLDERRITTVAVIGPIAYPAVPAGGGTARVEPFVAVSYLEGLSNHLGASSRVHYSRGVPSFSEMAAATGFFTDATVSKPGLNAEYFSNDRLAGAPALTRTEQHINFGPGSRAALPDQTASSRWTGYFVPKSPGAHDVFVQSTGEEDAYRLYVDDRLVLDSWTGSRALIGSVALALDATPHKVVLEHRGRSSWVGWRLRLGFARRGQVVDEQTKQLASMADVVVIAAGFDHEGEGEGSDRTFALPPGQDELIREVASLNKRVIVVLTSGGGVDMSGWLDRVPALIQAWYPGQEGGTALAEVLFGAVNPSGRLPVTFERRWEDNPTYASYYPPANTKRVEYKEGVFVGYRGYERNNTRPLFPFGHGMSYTAFEYSDLVVKPVSGGAPRYEVSFDVMNTGRHAGADVAQVYVRDPHSTVQRPAKELKGFVKVSLRAGERRRLMVPLDARALSFYDVSARQWRAEPGDFEVLVGRSSERIELRGKLTLPMQ